MPSNEELVKLIQQGVDVKENQEKLWNQNKNFVYSVLREKNWAQSDVKEDLIQQAFLGMMNAAAYYKQINGAKFITYAKSFIYGSMMQYKRAMYSHLYIPSYMKDLIRKYEKISQGEFGKLSDSEICLKIGIKQVALDDLKKIIQRVKVYSLDAYVNNSDKEMCYKDFIASDENIEEAVTGSVYEKELHKALQDALSILDEKTQMMIKCVYFQGYSMKRTAKIFRCNRTCATDRIYGGFIKILNSKHREILEQFMWEGFQYRENIFRREKYEMRKDRYERAAEDEKYDIYDDTNEFLI